MRGDWFVALLLRSPLHGMMSASTMLVSVTGRRSGRQITTPVSYYESDGALWVLSRRDRTWWRNLKDGAEAGLRLRGRDVRAWGEVLLEQPAVAARLGDYLARYPRLARYLNIAMQAGVPDQVDLARESGVRVFVKFVLR